jgi:hypothetical protein
MKERLSAVSANLAHTKRYVKKQEKFQRNVFNGKAEKTPLSHRMKTCFSKAKKKVSSEELTLS